MPGKFKTLQVVLDWNPEKYIKQASEISKEVEHYRFIYGFSMKKSANFVSTSPTHLPISTRRDGGGPTMNFPMDILQCN